MADQTCSRYLSAATAMPIAPGITRHTCSMTHVHTCPICYRRAPCEMDCATEPDLTLDDGTRCGNHLICDQCSCPDCDGRGYWIVDDMCGPEPTQYTRECETCGGSGLREVLPP